MPQLSQIGIVSWGEGCAFEGYLVFMLGTYGHNTWIMIIDTKGIHCTFMLHKDEMAVR